jgi:hypothetical protein
MSRYVLDDDIDDDPDDDDDVDEDDEDSDEEDDEDTDVETWQVSTNTLPLKRGLSLTSGTELPMLTPISQLCYSWRHSAGLASRRRSNLSKAPVTG